MLLYVYIIFSGSFFASAFQNYNCALRYTVGSGLLGLVEPGSAKALHG